MKKVLAVALATIMAAGAVTGCKSGGSKGGTTGNANIPITACIGSEPKSIDPAINQAVDGATYISHAFEGLTKTDKNNKIVKGVASDVKTSSDGLTYTYTIRSDAKWSDGKAVTAKDFVYAWQRAVNPMTASPYAYQLYYVKNAENINSESVDKSGKPQKVKMGTDGKPVKDAKGNFTPDANGKYTVAKPDGSAYTVDDLGAVAKDDHTLVVTLEAPCAYFDQITAFPTLSPVREDVVSKSPDTWANSPATYISNGPYKLSSWAHGSKMVFTKNPNYYDAKDIVSNEIDFLLMDDVGSILNAYKNGSILLAEDYPPDELTSLVKSGDCTIYGNLGTYYYVFNSKKAPFDNEKVREALTLAIDREYLVKNVSKGGETPAGAFVPNGVPDAKAGDEFRKVGGNYFDPSGSAYQANVAKAKQLLADAGYPDGKGFPTFEIKYNTNANHQNIAQYIQSEWKKNLGLNVTLANEEWATFIADRNAGNYQVARDGWLGDYVDPMTFLDLFTTNSGNNDGKWSNPQYDSLIAEAKKNSDEAKRMKDMHDAEALLMKDYDACPIYFYTDPDLVSPKLQGYVHSPLGYKFLMWASVDPNAKAKPATSTASSK